MFIVEIIFSYFQGCYSSVSIAGTGHPLRTVKGCMDVGQQCSQEGYITNGRYYKKYCCWENNCNEGPSPWCLNVVLIIQHTTCIYSFLLSNKIINKYLQIHISLNCAVDKLETWLKLSTGAVYHSSLTKNIKSSLGKG